MSTQEIAAALPRVEAVLRRRPGLGLQDDTPATARWERGTRIVGSHADGTPMATDMPNELGGTGDEVTPGWLFCAGRAACSAWRTRPARRAPGPCDVQLHVRISANESSRALARAGRRRLPLLAQSQRRDRCRAGGAAHRRRRRIVRAVDALSETLRVVRLVGAIFINGRFTAPWCYHSPSADAAAPFLEPGAERVVIFHLITEGECYVELGSEPPVRLTAGDVVVFPKGHAHCMTSQPGLLPAKGARLDQVLARRPRELAYGGGGPTTRLVCGYLACDARLAQMLLAGLPSLLRVNVRGSNAGMWLEASVRYALAEARSPRLGGAGVLAKLAERFQQLVGSSPMQYLTQWRMLLAANLLSRSSAPLARIAEDVGYQTDTAFSRAFRREYGAPPAAWRKRQAGRELAR